MSGRSQITVCVPVTAEDLLGLRWGRADRVAVATVSEDGIDDWQEFDVGWGDLHDTGSEGFAPRPHRPLPARSRVEAVAAHHMQ